MICKLHLFYSRLVIDKINSWKLCSQQRIPVQEMFVDLPQCQRNKTKECYILKGVVQQQQKKT